MEDTNVRKVCLFITVGLILTVLHIGQTSQLQFTITNKPNLGYPKPVKTASKSKAIETGIFTLILRPIGSCNSLKISLIFQQHNSWSLLQIQKWMVIYYVKKYVKQSQ